MVKLIALCTNEGDNKFIKLYNSLKLKADIRDKKDYESDISANVQFNFAIEDL